MQPTEQAHRRQFLKTAAGTGLALAGSGVLAQAFDFKPHQRYPDPAIQILDPGFAKYRIYSSTIEQLATGMRWAEGPAYFPDNGGYLLLSDIPNNRIMKYSEKDGSFTVFRKPANWANGNVRDRQGRLVTCEHSETRRVTRTEKNGKITVLADSFEGKRLNAPNDIVVKSDDSIWFTDPLFGINGEWEGYKAKPEQPTTNVYRIAPDGSLSAVITDLVNPNGLAFSPDESRLYVADMSIVDFPLQGRRHLLVYDVIEGRRLSNPRVLAQIEPGIPDGFRVDQCGNIFCSCEDGILVLAGDGQRIGKIGVPERVSNCTFGGPAQDELFITATTSLYRVRLATQGCQYSHLLHE